MSAQTTRKGDAFIRYYYIDRGAEEDLTIEEAMEDFEEYIYKPLANYVTRELITDTVREAIDMHVADGRRPEDMTEDDTEEVCKIIGFGFLLAYKDIHGPFDD